MYDEETDARLTAAAGFRNRPAGEQETRPDRRVLHALTNIEGLPLYRLVCIQTIVEDEKV